jgi:beta-glucanase (GH16 family)
MAQSRAASEPTREEQRQELGRILEYPGVARSTNLVRMLTFVCEKQFEGRTDELRESSIAIHALGRRKEDFDPQADPIVRVTARTLRQRLAEYYRSEGRDHEVQLFLPTGQYVPRFVRRPSGAEGDLAAGEANGQDDGVRPSPTPEPASGPAERAAWRRRARLPALVLVGVLACALSFWAGRATTPASTGAAAPCACGVWGNPVWSDEFEGPKGAVPDPSTWTYDVGNNGGWGNLEQEVYCAPGTSTPDPCSAERPNAFLDGAGHLVIEARRQGGNWTSARLTTQGRREIQYGRVEARMKMPVGAGLWPAFWMLGYDVAEVGWPRSGSITVAENVPQRATSNGLGPTMVRSTLHGPGYFGGNGLWQNFTLPGEGRVDDAGYHVYGAIWSPGMMQFYVDDVSNVFFVVTEDHLPTGGRWAFDHPFFVVLNLAVGGQWPGPPEASTPSPAQVLVDYVRHYRSAQVPGPRIAAPGIAVRAGETASSTLRLTSAVGTGRARVSCSGAPLGATCTLSPPVVDFSTVATQPVMLTVSAASPATSKLVATAGSYRLRITATTISGDQSAADVALTIRD